MALVFLAKSKWRQPHDFMRFFSQNHEEYFRNQNDPCSSVEPKQSAVIRHLAESFSSEENFIFTPIFEQVFDLCQNDFTWASIFCKDSSFIFSISQGNTEFIQSTARNRRNIKYEIALVIFVAHLFTSLFFYIMIVSQGF